MKFIFNPAEDAHQTVTLEIARGDWITSICFIQKMYYALEKNHLIINYKCIISLRKYLGKYTSLVMKLF